MDITKIIDFLKSCPKWAKIIVPVLLSALASIYLFCSCGTTKVVAKTSDSGQMSATISVSTNNPTSVDLRSKIDTIGFDFNKRK